MAHLSLSLIGSFEAALDGHPLVNFRSQKVRAFLAYLAAESDHPHPRPLLAGLLWPDLPDRSALMNLRTALWNVREVCNDRDASSPMFIVAADTIRLNLAADVWVDLDAFLELSCIEDRRPLDGISWPTIALLEKAGTLYRGPFLEGFFVDSAPFEEWILLRREQAQRRMVEVLRYLAAAYEQSGDYHRALAHVQRHLEIDRLEEEAHQRAMRLYALSGHRGAAILQYEICRRILRDELGIEPSQETQAIVAELRQGQLEVWTHDSARSESVRFLQHPLSAIPLFGRDKEIAEINSLLENKIRLLSIVGPGGSGKTRLALEIAQQSTVSYPDGVAFVDLTALDGTEALVPAVADALGLVGEGKIITDLKLHVLAELRQRSMLLVLDNYEHLLDAASFLTEILAAAPDVRVLVTSRERLKLQSEHIYLLQGLAYTEWKSVTEAAENPAAQLFLHHAQRVCHSFTLREEHLQPLRIILELVEGMPLALILAAVWLELLSLAEVAAEICRSLEFLEAPYRDLPPRQRSMRALFEGTWERLNDKQQRLFAGLALFRGGFTLEAAQMVTGARPRDLIRFVDLSMLTRVEDGRFAIHELLRQFAAEELGKLPEEEEALRERHAMYFCQFLKQQTAQMRSVDANKANEAIARDFENVRIAWNWSADNKKVTLLEQAMMILGLYCVREGRRAEGAVLFKHAAEALSGTTSATGRRVLAYLLAGHCAFVSGVVPLEERQQALTEALELLAEAAALGEDVRHEKAGALMILGQVLTSTDYRIARSVLLTSIALFEQLESWFELANVYGDLAKTYEVEADYDLAYDCARKALQRWEMVGEPHWINQSRLQLAVIKTKLGDVEQGVKEIREVIARFKNAGNRFFAAEAELAMSEGLVALGRIDEALASIVQNQAYFADMHLINLSRRAWCLAALHQGKFSEVWQQSLLLLADYRQAGTASQIGEAALLNGCAALALGNVDDAVTVLQTSLVSSQASDRPELLGQALAVSSCAALYSGEEVTARHQLARALKLASTWRLPAASAIGLTVLSLLHAERGDRERAIELYELSCRDPFVANSSWFSEVFGQRVAKVAATLPEEVVMEIMKRSGRMDKWETVDASIQELE